MGSALWLAAAGLAFAAARFIRAGRRRWPGELAVALLAGLALGVTATALDFGGWREPDPRAALFCGLGSFAILGILRVTTHKLGSEAKT
jgi:hypothetical protein